MYRKSFLGSLRPFDVAQGRLCGGHSELLAASPRRVVCGEYTRSGKDTLHNMVARANSVFFLPPICLGLRGPTRTANVPSSRHLLWLRLTGINTQDDRRVFCIRSVLVLYLFFAARAA